MAPGLSSLPVAPFLPELPDIDIGLARQPLSEGNVLTNAVEEMLKQLV